MSVASQNQTCFVGAKKLILPTGSLGNKGMCLRLKYLARNGNKQNLEFSLKLS